MKLKALAAAVIVTVSVPVAVQDADGQTARTPEKRYCEVNLPTGSRLGAVRSCRTKAERAAARAETRKTIERIQSQKNFTESMTQMRALCPGSGGRAC